jgi:hypothetical protein
VTNAQLSLSAPLSFLERGRNLNKREKWESDVSG